jgi:hypothetical protein
MTTSEIEALRRLVATADDVALGQAARVTMTKLLDEREVLLEALKRCASQARFKDPRRSDEIREAISKAEAML